MHRLASRLGLSRSTKQPTFKEWEDTATTDDIYDLFTTLIKSGAPDGQAAGVSASKLDFFERLLTSFPSHAAIEVDIKDVQAHLLKSFAPLASHIEAAFPTISLLLFSHASFPFATEVPFTKDALLRSLALLTQSSEYMFSQSADVGQEPAIRARSRTARVTFISSVLARPEPPTGVPTKDDVLDVLCRIRYPAPSSPSYSQRRPIAALEPLAGRLLRGSSELSRREGLRVSMPTLRPLADICNVLRNDSGVEAEKLLKGKESLDERDFKQWAKAMSLLACLDRLLCVFFGSLQK